MPSAVEPPVEGALLPARGGAGAAVGFALLSPVAWSAALPLALGCLVGGRLGPRVVRRAPQTALRRLIALAGLGLAVVLAVEAYA